MPSILDRETPRPVVIPANQGPTWVIIVISILLLIAFWVWMLFIIRSNPVSGSVSLQCAPGQCATDITTGVKDCPADPGDIKIIDPATQVCNSPFTCESDRTPFALQSDGSTDNQGQCQSGVQCRCLERPQCAYNVTAFFNTQNGNPFQAIDAQRVVFEQSTGGLNSAGQFTPIPPYAFTSSTTQFCGIPLEWADRTYPPVIQNNQLSSCIAGTIAFTPEDPDDFTVNDIQTTPLSCVQGNPCDPDQTPVWNNKTYQLDCKPLDIREDIANFFSGNGGNGS